MVLIIFKISIHPYWLTYSVFIDLLSGPISLLFDIYDLAHYGYLKSGPILRIFKLVNTENNKAIIEKLMKIIP